jgi:hypothetical protein
MLTSSWASRWKLSCAATWSTLNTPSVGSPLLVAIASPAALADDVVVKAGRREMPAVRAGTVAVRARADSPALPALLGAQATCGRASGHRWR